MARSLEAIQRARLKYRQSDVAKECARRRVKRTSFALAVLREAEAVMKSQPVTRGGDRRAALVRLVVAAIKRRQEEANGGEAGAGASS